MDSEVSELANGFAQLQCLELAQKFGCLRGYLHICTAY